MWYLRLVGIILILVLGCQPKRVSRNPLDSHVSIYRFINTAGGGTIRLGDPFTANGLAVVQDDSILLLRPGAVLDPDKVRIFVTQDRTVYAMDFEYVAGETFKEQLALYTRLLGPPSQTTRQLDGTAVARWEDDLTRFDLSGPPGQNVRSRLTDRRLGHV